MEGITRRLAQYVIGARWHDLPLAVRHKAARLFVNWVGVTLGGSSHAATDRAQAAHALLAGAPQATVLGRNVRFDMATAALLNGTAASAYAFDDTHLPTVAHPTAPGAAALLALAEHRVISGADFLHALILSVEIQCRLSVALAVAPARTHVGFYMTGITGAAGVAASVGKLLGLDEQHLIWAIGLGAAQGSGFRATHASMASPWVPGLAGRNGLVAALLAANGFTGTNAMLEARNGFGDVYGTPARLDAVLDGIGERFECLQIAEKPYPAGVFIHPAIEACLRLAGEEAPDADAVESLDLKVHSLATGLTGKPEPADAWDAQVSVYHWAAAALLHGAAGLPQAADECVRDPRVIALRRKVRVTVDPDVAGDEALAVLVLKGGARRSVSVRPCTGSGRRPMPDADLDRKFLGQAEPVTGPARARALLDACWNLASASDVRAVAPGVWG